MTTLILDGYNVIHAVPEMARQLDRSLQSAREALVRFCQDYRRRRGDIGRLYIVFDGRDAEAFGLREQEQGGVTVCFAQHPEEADRKILRVIEAQGRRTRCVVVSNDNEVANNARAFGAGLMSVREFYAHAQPASRAAAQSEGDRKIMPSSSATRKITDELRKHFG